MSVEKIEDAINVLWSEFPLVKAFLSQGADNKYVEFADNKYIIETASQMPSNFMGVRKGAYVTQPSQAAVSRMTASLVKMTMDLQIDWEDDVISGSAYIKKLTKVATEFAEAGARHIAEAHFIGAGDHLANYPGALARVHTGSDTDNIILKEHGITDSGDGGATLRSSGWNGVRLLHPGMAIVIDTADNLLAGTENTACYTTISSVDPDSHSIVVAADLVAAGVLEGDLVVLGQLNQDGATYSNSYAKTGLTPLSAVPTGIREHASKINAIYQGLDRTTHPEIKANVLNASGVSRAVSSDLLNAAWNASQIYSLGAVDPTMCITGLEVATQIAKIYAGLRIFNSEERAGEKPAITNVDVVGLRPLIVPRFTRGAVLFAHKRDLVTAYPGKPFAWHRWPSGEIFTMGGNNWNKDILGARLRSFGQLIGRKPRGLTWLGDLLEA